MNVIDEYIENQEAAVQSRLNEIREIIRNTMPDAVEKISYKMPTYWKGRNIIHFAAFKNHIGLYPGGEATTVFAGQLKDYKTSKGTIQIRHNQEMPVDLIQEIASWCYDKYGK